MTRVRGITAQLTALTSLVVAAAALAGCGGQASSTSTASGGVSSGSNATRTRRPLATRPKPPRPPQVLGAAHSATPTGFVPAVRYRGQTAVWIARSATGAGLLSFDQRLLELALHSGSVDAGGSGWRYGPAIAGAERKHLVAAFNGGFKFDTGAGGFVSGGRTAVPLRAGLGSIVTYADGSTDIGSWHGEVPSPGRRVADVRQNLTLLVDHGRASSTVGCLLCWGATLGGVGDPARSGLGITADGHLIWAGGEHLTVAQLAGALLGARVVRAVELDINPEWVAAYLYEHHGTGGSVLPVPVVPGQNGVPGFFLAPYERDFFALHTRA